MNSTQTLSFPQRARQRIIGVIHPQIKRVVRSRTKRVVLRRIKRRRTWSRARRRRVRQARRRRRGSRRFRLHRRRSGRRRRRSRRCRWRCRRSKRHPRCARKRLERHAAPRLFWALQHISNYGPLNRRLIRPRRWPRRVPRTAKRRHTHSRYAKPCLHRKAHRRRLRPRLLLKNRYWRQTRRR